MKWVIIKGVRYPISVVSAFAAYYGDNPFLKIRIRNKYHIIYFDNMDYRDLQSSPLQGLYCKIVYSYLPIIPKEEKRNTVKIEISTK